MEHGRCLESCRQSDVSKRGQVLQKMKQGRTKYKNGNKCAVMWLVQCSQDKH